jgi:hypothetical protein
MTDDDLLNQSLTGEFGFSADTAIQFASRQAGFHMPTPAADQSAVSPADYRQWQVAPNDTFRPAGATVPSLPPGVYAVRFDGYGPSLERRSVTCDDLVELPDHATARVLEGMQKFWASADRYHTLGLIYKRGVLLWGPQGSGKTVTVQFLIRALVAANGIVLLFASPDVTLSMLNVVRRIEPSRRVILVMEDIDEIIARYGEHEVLSLLDGENQTDNVVHIATTNHPERLGARILNRPSRFDERIFVPMPSPESRLTYLRTATQRSGSQLTDSELLGWRDDTEGMSIAHLRELVAGVFCLDQPYETVLARLKAMAVKPADPDGFARFTFGAADR